MCYRGKENSIRLCDKHSTGSRTLLIDCWYFKGNSHSIRLCTVFSMPRWMPNSVQMYHIFCLASLPHVLFVFSFRCAQLWTYMRCFVRLAIHLPQKWLLNMKNEKSISGFVLRTFLRFLQHFAPGSAFTQKVKGFRGLFFHSVNKTQNSHEIQKVWNAGKMWKTKNV